MLYKQENVLMQGNLLNLENPNSLKSHYLVSVYVRKRMSRFQNKFHQPK